METPFTTTSDAGQLTVNHPDFFTKGTQKWSARAVGESQLLLTPENQSISKDLARGTFDAISASPDVIVDILTGIHERHWSGVVVAEVSCGIKRLFFRDGEIVSATSMVMDDRLGEVIYRGGMISLEELTTSAAQVDRDRRFGQVLVGGGLFTNRQLYLALQTQFLQILRSIFCETKAFIWLSNAAAEPPVEVIFEEGTRQIVEDAYCFGEITRDFIASLTDETVVSVKHFAEANMKYPEGTFKGDLLGMIGHSADLRSILQSSKLQTSYTMAAIADLVFEDVCVVHRKFSPALRGYSGPEISAIKAKVDQYLVILEIAKKTFADVGVEFPLAELSAFAKTLNQRRLSAIFLEETGALHRESVYSMLLQSRINRGKSEYFLRALSSLVEFILMLCSDQLPRNRANEVRSRFRETSS